MNIGFKTAINLIKNSLYANNPQIAIAISGRKGDYRYFHFVWL